MARPKGIVKLKGKVGNLSFYKRKGVNVVREAGGPTAAQIKKRRSMQRTRENINEFYHAASPAGKALRIGLKGLSHLWHCDTSGKLAGRLRQIMQCAQGVRGERSLKLSDAQSLLTGFVFQPDYRFEGIFAAPYAVSVNAARNEATFDIPSFDPSRMIGAPAGATHFKLLMVVCVLSEYVFVRNATPYAPVDGKANSTSGQVVSDFISLKGTTAPFKFQAALPRGIVPMATSGVVVAMGIQFWQEVNGEMYGLKGGSMRVCEVF